VTKYTEDSSNFGADGPFFHIVCIEIPQRRSWSLSMRCTENQCRQVVRTTIDSSPSSRSRTAK